MGIVVRSYRKGDRNRVSELVSTGDLVLAVDPGAHGMACLFRSVDTWIDDVPPKPYARAALFGFDCTGIKTMLTMMQARPCVVVMEETFGGGRLNVSSDLALARYAGAFLGTLNALGVRSLDVALIPPAVWFKALCSTKMEREGRKKLARDHAVANLGEKVVWESASLSPHREAYCDVYGIATWWGGFAREVRADLYGRK